MPYSDRRGAVPALTEGDAMVIGWIMLIVLWVVIIAFALGAIVFMFRSAGR
jgi:flagellar basal body-associated protein FliL